MALLNKKCPQITGLTFIKGDALKIPAPNRPTIIEFWATWCGPCRVAFPHLSELARRFKSFGLVVVGVNIEEDGVQAARKMVADQGSKMDYTVVVDSERVAGNLMADAGLSGIPCAFIIDARGIIRHYGHPMEPKFTQIVEQVCKEAGKVPAGEASASGEAPPAAAPAKQSMAGKTRDDLVKLPVKDLKAILDSWQVGYKDLNEKSEMVDRILEQCK